MFKRIKKIIQLSKVPDGGMEIVVCQQCNSYRSDLEWREKKITKCLRCGSNKVTYPPKIPLIAIISLVIRYVIKGY